MTDRKLKYFWAKVDKESTECWLWTASTFREGYGKFQVGTNRDTNRIDYAHRISWRLANGCEIPAGLHVLHTCDNPLCVNPNHLYLGDAKQNATDRVRRARQRGFTGGRVDRWTPPDHQRAATHCNKGHLMDRENTYVSPTGFRRCRACHRDLESARYERSRKGKRRNNTLTTNDKRRWRQP